MCVKIMAYYISFLKTLSLKLNENTVHFFYNEATHDFPLYTEAIKFFNHPEGMVRIAVRTLTLNVWKGRVPSSSPSPSPSLPCRWGIGNVGRSSGRVNAGLHLRPDGGPLLQQPRLVHREARPRDRGPRRRL